MTKYFFKVVTAPSHLNQSIVSNKKRQGRIRDETIQRIWRKVDLVRYIFCCSFHGVPYDFNVGCRNRNMFVDFNNLCVQIVVVAVPQDIKRFLTSTC